MANYINKNNRHLLLEPQANENNSFIANVNALVKNFDEVVLFNNTFDDKSVELLKTLLATTDSNGNTVADSFMAIAEDLRKGSYNGYRKLDIDLLKNFHGYSDDLTTKEKLALWGDEANRVYYSGCEIFLDYNGNKLEYTFSKLLWSAPDLYNELLTIINSFKSSDDTSLIYYPVKKTTTVTTKSTTGETIGASTVTEEIIYDGSVSADLNYTTHILNSDGSYTYTTIVTEALYDNIVRTGITATGLDNVTIEESAENRYIVRLYDNFAYDLGVMQESNITSIKLIQATEAEYLTIHSGVTRNGSNVKDPVYTWTDTTSALYTVANNVVSIASTADEIRTLGDNYIQELKALQNNMVTNSEASEAYANLATDRANEAAKYLEALKKIGIEYSVVSALDDPSVTYNGDENKFTFELPRNLITAVDLTAWALDNANGHLTLNTISEEDIDSVEVDESNGKVIINLKS